MRKPRFQFSTIHNFLSKFPGFCDPEKHSLAFLNSAQFLGALNDNIYKLALIFFLIGLLGEGNANTILSIIGAVFVIPFLLFSSMAGILADRFSKNRIVMIIKAAEIVIILGVILAFWVKEVWGSYFLLFLLATQSAMFGPSKYGIIPELVPKTKASKANGLVTSFTYLAIILGTFLASFLVQMTGGNYILVGCFCLLVAVAGFISSFGIKHTPPKGSTKKIDPFFLRQIFHTLHECRKYKHLLISISASAYFLFIGAFTQLNVIPFAIQALDLSKEAGGYLFLAAALGIATGAVIAGRASKKRIELGLGCVSGLVIALSFFILGISTAHLILAILALFILGVAGGTFTVPFDTFIQLESPEANRGHVIAATNFMSFVGVLLASFALYFFNELFGLTSASSFWVMAVITLLFSIFLMIRLSDLCLSYLAKNILFRLIPMKTEGLRLFHKAEKPLLMLEEGSWFKAWILCGIISDLHLLIPQHKVRRFPWFERLFYSIHRVESPQKFETLVSHGKVFLDEKVTPCIYLQKKKPIPDRQTSKLQSILQRRKFEVITVNFQKTGKTTTVRFKTD